MELIKQSSWSTLHPRLYHFRTAACHEVDLVLEDAAGRIVGIEVKSTKSVSASDFKGLESLREIAGKKFLRGIVLYDGLEAVSFGREMSALPISSLWTL